MLENAVKDCLIAGIIEKSGAEPETKEELLDYFVTLKDGSRVVRCKECSVPHNRWTGCPKLNGLIPPPDFYCAYGERRTE